MKAVFGMACAVIAAAAFAEPMKFRCDESEITFGENGAVTSIRERATGRELVAKPNPFVSVHLSGGREAAAVSARRRGDAVVFALADGAGEVSVRVESQSWGWRFTVERADVPRADSVVWSALEPVCRLYEGRKYSNMYSDEKSGVALRTADVAIEMLIENGRISLRHAAPPASWVGREFYLFAAPRERLVVVAKEAILASGEPRLTTGGPWSLDSPENRRSYLFAPLAAREADDWIDLARRGGFGVLHMSAWYSAWGHYPLKPNLYPNGISDMREVSDKIHAAGMHSSVHTLSSNIPATDPWITPEAPEDLLEYCAYTLDGKVGENGGELRVRERPIDGHSLVFTYFSKGNVLRLDHELVQYTGVRREKPYGFTGIKRGAFGTRRQEHADGTRVAYLRHEFGAFSPKPGSPLAAKMADALGAVIKGADIDDVYLDGMEGPRGKLEIAALRREMTARFKTNAVVAASCSAQHIWAINSRFGTFDHPLWNPKRFHDMHMKVAIERRKSDLTAPDLGWWATIPWSEAVRCRYLDETEYFAAKNAGMDVAMSLHKISAAKGAPDPYEDKQITVMGWYERFRLARAWAPGVQDRLAEPRREFRLRQDDGGVWRLRTVDCRTRRVVAAEERWRERFAEDVAVALRVEALYRAAPTNAKSIVLWKDPTVGKLEFPMPHGTSIPGTRGFRMRVAGNGRNTMFRLRVESPEEYHRAISDHYFTTDFEGERELQFLLRERQVGGPDGNSPILGTYESARNQLNGLHISEVSIAVVKGSPAGVSFGPLVTCGHEEAPLTRPSVSLNGERFAMPFDLVSGEWAELEDGFWTRYSKFGVEEERRPAAAMPRVRAGDNEIAFAAEGAPRAEITVFALGEPFAALDPAKTAEADSFLGYEAAETFVHAPARGFDSAPALRVRPGERARVQLEVIGPAASPRVSIGGAEAAFPVVLKEANRLVMKNGRDWWVVDTNRNCLAEGALPKALPVFSGVNPVSVSTADEQGAYAHVRLVKRYVTSFDDGFDKYEGRPAKRQGGAKAKRPGGKSAGPVLIEGYQDDGTGGR